MNALDGWLLGFGIGLAYYTIKFILLYKGFL